MRTLHLLLLSVLLLQAAAPPSGRYTGEWKSDSSGNGGTLTMTLESATKCEITFTLAGETVKTKMQSFKLDGSQLDVAYDFEVQGATLRSKLNGKWEGATFSGRYQTTVVDSGDPVDAGTWKAALPK